MGINFNEILTRNNEHGFNPLHLAIGDMRKYNLDNIYDLIEQLDQTKKKLKEMLLQKTNKKGTILHLAT